MSFTNAIHGGIAGAGRLTGKASDYIGQGYKKASDSYSKLGDNVQAGVRYGAGTLGGAGIGYLASDGGAMGTAAGAGLGAGAAWGAGRYGSTIAGSIKGAYGSAKDSWKLGMSSKNLNTAASGPFSYIP